MNTDETQTDEILEIDPLAAGNEHTPYIDLPDDDEAGDAPPSDEGDTEGEPDGANEGETENPEGESKPEDGGETFKVTVDGEELEVTREELLAGYSRQADYTRKTQELATKVEEFETLQADTIRGATAYEALNERYGSGVEGAAGVLRDLARSAALSYAKDAPAQAAELLDAVQDALIEVYAERAPGLALEVGQGDIKIDPEKATETEVALSLRLRSTEARLARAERELQAMVEAGRDAIARTREQTLSEKAVPVIAAKYGATVDANQLTQLMKTHGVEDPIKAFLIERGSNPPAPVASEKSATPEVAPRSAPAPSKALIYDPDDPALTADEELRLLRQGYKPSKG